MKGTKYKSFDILGIRKAWNDYQNYKDWIKTIKREEANPDSIYRRFNMGKNYFYNIFVIITLPGEDINLPEEIQRLRIVESLVPINRYLDETLRFAEYLTPEFNRIRHDDLPTLNYLIVYRFTFRKLSIQYVLTRLGLIGGLIYAGFKIPWETIVTWISGLI